MREFFELRAFVACDLASEEQFSFPKLSWVNIKVISKGWRGLIYFTLKSDGALISCALVLLYFIYIYIYTHV